MIKKIRLLGILSILILSLASVGAIMATSTFLNNDHACCPDNQCNPNSQCCLDNQSSQCCPDDQCNLNSQCCSDNQCR
ncbi:MAG: hypothetical protein LBT10_01670 [Methanobrevibacter sp.]|nr:hypothetical protein [Methanobrevibacter sp.]